MKERYWRRTMIEGSMVALVTPFKDGAVDREALKGLVEFHIENGTDVIVPCGTTGESATLTHDEHEFVVEYVVEVAAGRVKILAGAGSNSTKEAIRLSKHAERVGADGVLLITPYYNKPTQEGLYQHYKAISEEISIPIVVYNVPSRTGIDILPETVARLSELGNIVGIKEATGSMRRASEIISLCGDKIAVISGDDFTYFPLLSVGGKGVISVAANVVPDKMARIWDLTREGRWDEARRIHYELFPLFKALFLETNPIPVKAALSMMGMIEDEIRLPLTRLSESNRKTLSSVLKDLGLIG